MFNVLILKYSYILCCYLLQLKWCTVYVIGITNWHGINIIIIIFFLQKMQ